MIDADNVIDSKLHERQKWGKAFHNLPRFAATLNACRTLAKRGEPVTRNAVKLMLGGGSDRDVAPIVQVFNARNAVLSRFEDTPDTLAMLIMESINQVLADHNHQHDQRMEQEAETFGDALARQASEIANLELESLQHKTVIEQRDSTIEQLNAELAQAREKISQLTGKLGVERNAHTTTVTQKNALQSQLAEKTADMAAMREEHQAAIDKQNALHSAHVAQLNATHDKEVDRLMGQIDKARDAAKAAQSEAKTQVKKLTEQLLTLRKTNQSQTSTIAGLETLVNQAPDLQTAVKAQQQLQHQTNMISEQVAKGEQGRAELKALVVNLTEKPAFDSDTLKTMLEDIVSTLKPELDKTKKEQ